MPELAKLLEGLAATDPALRAQAAWELGNLGPAAAPGAEALVQALRDESLRACAGWALVKIGGPAVEALAGALGHGDSQVRLAAVGALWKIAPERGAVVVGALEVALRDGDEGVRAYAAWALGEIGRTAGPAIGSLTAGLDDAAPVVRARIAEALGRIGEPTVAAVGGLTSALRDSDNSVRRAAGAALLELASAHRAAALRSALPALERLARQGPWAERALYRKAVAAIRVSAPPRNAPAGAEDTLPRPAHAVPDHNASTLPRAADQITE